MTPNNRASTDTTTLTRRRFLAATGVASAAFTLSSLPVQFAGKAAAQTGPRSLVCIFLAGGADSANMFAPLDNAVAGSTYDVYRATRGSYAVPAADLLPYANGDFGFSPNLAGLAGLAAEGRVAIVQNVGPLARPTTKADVQAQRSIPQSLFAHDAQQKLWQTGRPNLTSSQGWGGRMSAVVNAGAPVAPAFSIAGSNIFQSAQGGPYTRLSPTVPIYRLAGYDASVRGWIPGLQQVETLLKGSLTSAAGSPNELDQAVAESLTQSIVTTERLQAATAASAENEVGMADVAGGRLGGQLAQVARLIKNRTELKMDRQIFFVRLGGWDTHGQQAERLPVLLNELDAGLTSFQRALDDLGVADSVTTFTASDFGRTLTINGDGTDHGWGGHAFVCGGAVKGGRYGTFPNYSTANNPDDTGDGEANFAGRLIPTTAVCQYGATLARWMGLSDDQLTGVFPELTNFANNDLGFL